MHKYILFTLIVLLSFTSFCYAACIQPTGVEGKQVYNTTYKTMQFCNGTNWIDMKGSLGSSGILNIENCDQGESASWSSAAGGLKCPEDVTPDAFSFADVTDIAVSTLTESSAVIISGIDGSVAVSVSGDGSPVFRIGGGLWVTSGTITNGQTLELRLTSNAVNSAMNSATVTIDGVSDQWDVTTIALPSDCTASSETWLSNCTATVASATHGNNGVASIGDPGGCGTSYYGSGTFACSDGTFSYGSGSCVQQTACDLTPDGFSFTDQTGVSVSSVISSNSVTIAGINIASTITISGAGSPQFRINGGSWVMSGTITNGQTLELRLTSNAANSTMNSATVTVGGVSNQWDVSTEAPASCDGASVGGYCWYSTIAKYKNCNNICAGHGGINLVGTRDFAGSGGTNDNCYAVADAVTGDMEPWGGAPVPLSVAENSAALPIGCSVYRTNWWAAEFGGYVATVTRYTGAPTDAGTSYHSGSSGGYSGSNADAYRYCACNN